MGATEGDGVGPSWLLHAHPDDDAAPLAHTFGGDPVRCPMVGLVPDHLDIRTMYVEGDEVVDEDTGEPVVGEHDPAGDIIALTTIVFGGNAHHEDGSWTDEVGAQIQLIGNQPVYLAASLLASGETLEPGFIDTVLDMVEEQSGPDVFPAP